jgi:hypothetical protein
VVYQVANQAPNQAQGPALRNVTARYRAMAEALWKPETPRFINLGDTAFGEYAGAGWDECANGFRMLRRSASVRMGGPRAPGERLHIGVFRTTLFHLGVQVDGADLRMVDVERGGDLTELNIRLPDALATRPEIKLTLSNADPDPLKFGFLEIR